MPMVHPYLRSFFLDVFFWFANKEGTRTCTSGFSSSNYSKHAVRLTDRQRLCAPVLWPSRVSNFPSALQLLWTSNNTTSGAMSHPCSAVLHDRSQQMSRDIHMEDSSCGGPLSLDSAFCLRPPGPIRPHRCRAFTRRTFY